MTRVSALAFAGVAVLAIGGCGAQGRTAAAARTVTVNVHPATRPTASTTIAAPPKPPPPLFPRLLTGALGTQPTPGFVPAVRWDGHTAAWVARTTSGVTLLAFDQHLLELHLHAGAADEGVGWRFGGAVSPGEVRRVAAAFNGGFKFSTDPGGFQSYGRTAVPLRNGLGSVVTYADGGTDIGSWNQEVPAQGRAVVSVRQNLPLLIDHGGGPSTIDCLTCWGATLGGVSDPARSALGITSEGRLVWAGGEHLTVAALVGALEAAHVVRAVELDINPEWVNAYLYGHHAGGHGPPTPVQMVSGQQGIPGQFLAPWSRDFFTIVAR